MYKLYLTLSIIFLLFVNLKSNAQTVLPLNGPDCYGTNHDLFADLDAGKASILHFWMPNCSSCPPPAQKIQAMANNLLAIYPGMITAYAMPYNNTTTCHDANVWMLDNNLTLYMPYDSGEVQVANYGGFGMPTVVLLGGVGNDRRVLFSTMSFITSDTTIMRDSILALLNNSSNAVTEISSSIQSLRIYPNPASNVLNVSLDMKESGNLNIDLLDLNGKIVDSICHDENQNGNITKTLNTEFLSSGLYTVRIISNGKTTNKLFNVLH